VATVALGCSLFFTFLTYPGAADFQPAAAHSAAATTKCTLGLLGLVCINLPPGCTDVAGVVVCPTLPPAPSLPPLLPTPIPTPPPITTPTPTLGCVAACNPSGPGAPPRGGTTNQGTSAPVTAASTAALQQPQAAGADSHPNLLPVALAATTDPLRVPLQTESLSPPLLPAGVQAPLLWALLVILDAALATVVFMVARATRLHKPPSIVAP